MKYGFFFPPFFVSLSCSLFINFNPMVGFWKWQIIPGVYFYPTITEWLKKCWAFLWCLVIFEIRVWDPSYVITGQHVFQYDYYACIFRVRIAWKVVSLHLEVPCCQNLVEESLGVTVVRQAISPGSSGRMGALLLSGNLSNRNHLNDLFPLIDLKCWYFL